MYISSISNAQDEFRTPKKLLFVNGFSLYKSDFLNIYHADEENNLSGSQTQVHKRSEEKSIEINHYSKSSKYNYGLPNPQHSQNKVMSATLGTNSSRGAVNAHELL
jgi:hypothetical protein